MKKIVVWLLRAAVIALVLLPVLVPVIKKPRNELRNEKISVLVAPDIEITTELRSSILTKIRAFFGPSFTPDWRQFGARSQHPIQNFEELGQTIKREQGNVIVVAEPALWGPAARQFNAGLKNTAAFAEKRLFWTTPGDLRLSGAPAAHRYLGLSEVFLPNLSFLGEESIASVEVAGHLRAEESLQSEIVMRSGDSVLTSKPISIKADADGIVRTTVQIPLNFTRAGTQILTASLGSDDVAPALESASTTVSVSHAKATLLHIAVGPDWSLRNLRQKLKFWPNLDLLSYYILREISDDLSIPHNQLSLIEFPTEKLFGSELPNFHGIIAQNFPLDHYLNPQEAANLVSYVKNGGRLVLFSGPLSFESRDANIQSLSPCINTPEFDVDNLYHWESGDADVSGSDDLKSMLKNVSSHATAVGCQARPGSIVLARTAEGKHPTVVAMPVEKGLVLSFLSGDWHTHFAQVEVKNEAEKATQILAANAVDALFRWMVEFLQRRQDSGLRPPEPTGPRLYGADELMVVRSRGVGRLDKGVNVFSRDSVVAHGETKHLDFLNLDVVLMNHGVAPHRISDDRSPSLPLQLQFDDTPAGSALVHNVAWPVHDGNTQSAETLANPVLLQDIPAPQPQTAAQASGSGQIDQDEVPLLQAYPWLMALCLGLLALEEFLSHILWRKTFSKADGVSAR